MRQSLIGLMLLVSLGILGIFILWVKNFSFGSGRYQATIIFPNAGGMIQGTRVAYRGVKIGQVTDVEPQADGVAIGVEISSDLLIPSNSRIEAVQAGLVGETSIDITPLESLPPQEDIAKPLDPDCEPALIICNGSILPGENLLDVNALIRSTLRISNFLGDPETTTVVKSIAQNASDSLSSISEILAEFQKSGGMDNLNSTLNSVNLAADEITVLLTEVRQKGSVDTLNSTLASVGALSEEIRTFLAANQTNLASTLQNIAQTSDQLRLIAKSLTPIVQRVEQGELLDNLEDLSANATALSANLRNFSAQLEDPQTIMMLQQTLDSARSAFANIQKITSDVDELTGNPEVRQDLKKLIRGLSNLTSSTQLIQQQVEYDRAFKRIASEIAKTKLEAEGAEEQGSRGAGEER